MHCILSAKIFPNDWKTELRGSQEEVEIIKLETLKTIEKANIVTMTVSWHNQSHQSTLNIGPTEVFQGYSFTS